MAGKRTLTPAMREHLRRIASLGGRATAARHGGYAAAHAARKGKRTAAPTVHGSPLGTGQAAPPLKVKALTTKDLVGGKSYGLPPTAFMGSNKQRPPAATRTTSRSGTTRLKAATKAPRTSLSRSLR